MKYIELMVAMGVIMMIVILSTLMIYEFSKDCDNPNHNKCEVISKIVDFDIEMAGTGLYR